MTPKERARLLAISLYLTGVSLIISIAVWLHWAIAVGLIAVFLIFIASVIYQEAKK